MSKPLQIRPAKVTDLNQLLKLYAQLSPDNTPLPSAIAEALFDKISLYEGSAILIGVIDDIIVSTCTLIIIPNLTRAGKPYALIENVVTHAKYCRLGYAIALLDGAASRAWAHDCYKVMLMTGATEPATLAFYERAGFEQSKTGFQKRRLPKRQ